MNESFPADVYVDKFRWWAPHAPQNVARVARPAPHFVKEQFKQVKEAEAMEAKKKDHVAAVKKKKAKNTSGGELGKLKRAIASQQAKLARRVKVIQNKHKVPKLHELAAVPAALIGNLKKNLFK